MEQDKLQGSCPQKQRKVDGLQKTNRFSLLFLSFLQHVARVRDRIIEFSLSYFLRRGAVHN